MMEITYSYEIKKEPTKPKKQSKLRYYLFCIRWLWKNRKWENTRQKFKAMEKDYAKACKRGVK